MKCQNEVKVGDILSYVLVFAKNTDMYKDYRYCCLAVVQVVKKYNKVARVKFLDVLVDNSGNGIYRYLFDIGHLYNASYEYLHKIKTR